MPLHQPPERTTHDSGLVSLVLPMPNAHRAVVTIYLRTGSRYETERESGISHFLEHMLFRGTPNFPSAHALARAFEDLGGTLVASTAADHGTLAIAVPPENLPRVLEHLAEVVLSPTLSSIELERGIIREEILEDYDDEGQLLDGPSLVRELAFPGHGLGQAITGPLENIERFSLDDVRAHHLRTYVGERMVITVTGPVDVGAVEAKIARVFADLPRGERPLATPAPDAKGPEFLLVRYPGSSQTSLNVAYRGLSDRDRREPALDVLLRVIDDGMSTRLYHRLCDSRGLCYDAGASYEAYEETGLVEFGTETAHERAAVVLEELGALTRELADEGASAGEIERAKRRARWQTDAMFDSAVDVGDFLAMAELTQTAATPKARIEELEAVTLSDVHRVAEAVFRPAQRVIVAVGNPKREIVKELERLANAT